MKKTASEVIKCLIKMGTFASVSDVIDYDTAALVAMEMGCKVEKEVIVTVEEKLIDISEDKAEDLHGGWARGGENGGGSTIRTLEGNASRFTVCPR